MATRLTRFKDGSGDAGKLEAASMKSVRVSQGSRAAAHPAEVNGRLETFSDEYDRLKREKTELQGQISQLNLGIEKVIAKFNRQNPGARPGDYKRFRSELAEVSERHRLTDRVREIECRMSAIKGAARAENANRSKLENTWDNGRHPLYGLFVAMIDQQKRTNELLESLVNRLEPTP